MKDHIKVAVTADLHLGITPIAAIEAVADKMASEDPDVIVLAGDIAESRIDYELFHRCVSCFREKNTTSDRKYGVPVQTIVGNHDLWVGDSRILDSLDLWEFRGKSSLEIENWVKDGVAIVGSYLHYDYSARDTTGVTSAFGTDYFAANKGRVNNDGHYLEGLPSDIEFADSIGSKFMSRLQQAQNDNSIDSIVVITHVPCVEQQITRRPFDMAWSLGTPYFGNITYQDQIMGCSKVTNIVSAHSHVGVDVTVDRDDAASVRIINLDSDYHKPSYVVCDVPVFALQGDC